MILIYNYCLLASHPLCASPAMCWCVCVGGCPHVTVLDNIRAPLCAELSLVSPLTASGRNTAQLLPPPTSIVMSSGYHFISLGWAPTSGSLDNNIFFCLPHQHTALPTSIPATNIGGVTIILKGSRNPNILCVCMW